MKSTRRRSSRTDPARRRLGSHLEALESRQLLAQSPYLAIGDYATQQFLTERPPGPTPPVTIAHPIGSDPRLLNSLQNEGKYLTGQDRQGNRWQLKLTGPGEIIVTDTTPNDGVLDDDLNTIRLIGTDPNLSSLHGEVEQSARTPTDFSQLPTLGTLRFNRLVADQGVKAIVLNGFILTDTITPPGSASLSPAEIALNQTTGIVLHGGVGTLEFEGIDARFPAAFNPLPITIQIGNPTTPLKVAPFIRIDHIYNTSFNDTIFAPDAGTGLTPTPTIPTGPLTTPSVTLFVNGNIQSLDVVSISRQPDLSTLFPPINSGFLTVPTQIIPTNSAALEYQFPIVGTTGRTAVQAKGIGSIKVNGGATNVTFSKSAQPFQNSLTGLDHLGSAQFGGPVDGLAIDSRGDIGGLRFVRGIGSSIGVSPNPIYFGTPASQFGYAATGNIASQIITEGNIGHIIVAPNGQFLQITQDPAGIQSGLNGYTVYAYRPGTAIQTSLVAAAGSIGGVHIVGNLVNSEVKAGYNYYTALSGAEPVSGRSHIGPAKVRGDLVDSVVSSSYRPNDGIFGNGNDTAGDGTITGTQIGNVYRTAAGRTALGNQGSGFFSRYSSTNRRLKNITPRPLKHTIVTPTPVPPTIVAPPLPGPVIVRHGTPRHSGK